MPNTDLVEAAVLGASGVLLLTYRVLLYFNPGGLRDVFESLVLGVLSADAVLLAAKGIEGSGFTTLAATTLGEGQVPLLLFLGLLLGACCTCGVWLASGLLGALVAALFWDVGAGCLFGGQELVGSPHAGSLHGVWLG